MSVCQGCSAVDSVDSMCVTAGGMPLSAMTSAGSVRSFGDCAVRDAFYRQTVSELPPSLRLEPPPHPRAVDPAADPARQHRCGQHHAHGETVGELLDLRIGLAG